MSPTCTCSPMLRRGHPPVPTTDPECPLHGWQDAALVRGAHLRMPGDETPVRRARKVVRHA